MHGWLGVSNQRAAPAPEGVGTWDWWVWRLTPYPWRYENEADKCDPRSEAIPLIAPVFNFAVLVFLLWFMARKPLREALLKRAQTIRARIDDAQALKKKARAKLKECKQQLDGLGETLTGLRDKYAADAEAEKQSLIEQARLARERMLADAAFRVEQEGKAAQEALSRQAMHEALTAAEQLIRSRLTPADLDRLAEDYLGLVGAALREPSASPTKGASP